MSHFLTRLTAALMRSQLNILVDDSGCACIADFGLTRVTKNLDSVPSASNHNCTPLWTAPEVLIGGTYSKAGDIFSFAMVIIEVRRK